MNVWIHLLPFRTKAIALFLSQQENHFPFMLPLPGHVDAAYNIPCTVKQRIGSHIFPLGNATGPYSIAKQGFQVCHCLHSPDRFEPAAYTVCRRTFGGFEIFISSILEHVGNRINCRYGIGHFPQDSNAPDIVRF